MSDDLEFIDIALLKRIDEETTVEGFGSKISSTFFEAANLLGTLKIKGLIEIHSAIGNSPVLITEKGKLLLKELDMYSEVELTKTDLAVLGSIRGGMKDPKQVEAALNIKSSDIAYAIYKLVRKGLVDYKVRNAAVEIMLTTQGFEKENPVVKEHANRALAKVVLARSEAKGPGDIRNKVAEELAGEEFGDAEKDDIKLDETGISKALYYANKYKWHAAGLALVLVAAAIYAFIIAR